MKRVTRYLLALVLCLPMMSGIALADSIPQTRMDGTAFTARYETEAEPVLSLMSAEDEVTVDNILYSLSGTEASVVGYTKDTPSACTIPASITVDGTSYTVTSIANSAFYNCANLVTVSLPASVTSIGRAAFSGCIQLTGVDIPAAVTSIGERAFANCGAMTSITVDAGNPVYASVDGVLFQGTVLVQYPLGRTGRFYAAPEGTTEIGANAFCRAANLQTVTLPDTVTAIGDTAFQECEALESIDVGGGLQTICSGAFIDCTSLTALYLPASLQNIDSGSFRGTDSLTAVEVAEGCERFFDDGGVLYGYGYPSVNGLSTDKLTLYVYPAGSTAVSYTVLSGTEVILCQAFWDAERLTAVTLPNTLTTIEPGAFTETGLTSVVVPDSVTSLEDGAFQACAALADVTLGTGVTELCTGLFYNCDSLTVFTIPRQIVTMANDVFNGCDNLEAYVVEEGSTAYSSCDGVLYNVDQTELLACPAARRNPVLELPAAVTTISYGAFADCKYLQRITVAEENAVYYDVDGVLFERTGETEAEYATGYVDLGISLHTYPLGRTDTSYTVPDGVQTVAERAFSHNTTLTRLDLNQVTYLRQRAIYFCTNLQYVAGEALVGLGSCALFRSDSLAHITLPASLAYLGGQSLDFCYSLEYIEFLNSDEPIVGSNVCFGASGLRYVYVPFGTSVAYKSTLSGKLYPGAMIVEGRYVPESTLSGQIDLLTPESSVADINTAAAGVVRLLSSEIDELSDERIVKVDNLFQAAHADTLNVSVSSTNNNVAVQGAAVASGLVEQQSTDGTVSGTVAIAAAEQSKEAGELLNLTFTMTVNGAEKELQAPVLVKVTLPESMQDQEFLLVHRDDSGQESPVDYTRNGDTVTFRATSFSSYVFLAPCVSYSASQDGTLYLASYDQAGRMLSIQAWAVTAGERGTIPLQPQEGIHYRAFLLDGNNVPTGGAVVYFP